MFVRWRGVARATTQRELEAARDTSTRRLRGAIDHWRAVVVDHTQRLQHEHVALVFETQIAKTRAVMTWSRMTEQRVNERARDAHVTQAVLATKQRRWLRHMVLFDAALLCTGA